MKDLSYPFITVVVTTYNQADKVERCLDSVLGQTYSHFEVIVVDDGSKDQTFELLQKYKANEKVTLYRQDNFGGPARGRNYGITHGKGDWVAFLDGDDWWYSQKLEKVAALTIGQDVIFHELNYYDKNGKLPRTTNGRFLKTPFFEDLLINGNCLSNSGTSVRTAMLKRVGLLSEDKNLIAVEDYDLWIRLSRITERFIYIEECLGAYWYDTGTLSSPSAGYISRIQTVVSRYLDELVSDHQMEAILRAKYIIARNKLDLRDKSALSDFILIFLKSNRLRLKLRAIAFMAYTFLILKLGMGQRNK